LSEEISIKDAGIKKHMIKQKIKCFQKELVINIKIEIIDFRLELNFISMHSKKIQHKNL